MQTYHVRFLTDKEAMDFAMEMMEQHVMAGVSFGFGNTEAVVVVYLPEGTEMPESMKKAVPELVATDTESFPTDEDEAL